MIKKEVETFLYKVWGHHSMVKTKKRYPYERISYLKALFNAPTILMVVSPPVDFDVRFNSYSQLNGEPIKFFLYDTEVDLMVGNVSEINTSNSNWKSRLKYLIYTAEDRLQRSECPNCGFWLVQRCNQHGHDFIGCSGFPDCDYSNEIPIIFDDFED